MLSWEADLYELPEDLKLQFQ